jgi:hypothetical protein
MEEATAVLERLARIEALDGANVPPGTLLEELRALRRKRRPGRGWREVVAADEPSSGSVPHSHVT